MVSSQLSTCALPNSAAASASSETSVLTPGTASPADKTPTSDRSSARRTRTGRRDKQQQRRTSTRDHLDAGDTKQKRARAPPQPSKYYAVHKGSKSGVYDSWAECRKQVKGYSGNRHKSFDSERAAKLWLREQERIDETSSSPHVRGSSKRGTPKSAHRQRQRSVSLSRSSNSSMDSRAGVGGGRCCGGGCTDRE